MQLLSREALTQAAVKYLLPERTSAGMNRLGYWPLPGRGKNPKETAGAWILTQWSSPLPGHPRDDPSAEAKFTLTSAAISDDILLVCAVIPATGATCGTARRGSARLSSARLSSGPQSRSPVPARPAPLTLSAAQPRSLAARRPHRPAFTRLGAELAARPAPAGRGVAGAGPAPAPPGPPAARGRVCFARASALLQPVFLSVRCQRPLGQRRRRVPLVWCPLGFFCPLTGPAGTGP